jgi:predicted metal-dependent phosphoesterase TrpH
MRCDLHVHTLHSGPVDLPLLRHLSRECYSQPEEVYATAKARGMDLVTITDHDTIAGALQLAHLPDFIVGEEVTCEMGSRRQIHLGVWDLNEERHEAISRRRRDAEALFAWLAENEIPACINHPFSPLTGARKADDFHRAFASVALVEAQNGMMPSATNEFARQAGRALRRGMVAGSDAHTLAGIAHAFTHVPGARDREEFLAGLRAGLTIPRGGAGSYARLSRDVFSVFRGTLSENVSRALGSARDFARFAAMAPALLAVPFIPLIAVASYVHECLGGRIHHSRYQASLATRKLPTRRTPLRPSLALGGER